MNRVIRIYCGQATGGIHLQCVRKNVIQFLMNLYQLEFIAIHKYFSKKPWYFQLLNFPLLKIFQLKTNFTNETLLINETSSIICRSVIFWNESFPMIQTWSFREAKWIIINLNASQHSSYLISYLPKWIILAFSRL